MHIYHAYVYIIEYTDIYIYKHAYIHIYMYKDIYIHIYMHICAHVRVQFARRTQAGAVTPSNPARSVSPTSVVCYRPCPCVTHTQRGVGPVYLSPLPISCLIIIVHFVFCLICRYWKLFEFSALQKEGNLVTPE